MKYLISSFIFFFSFAISLPAQPSAEHIYSSTRVMKDFNYYYEQTILWQEKIEKTPEVADHWFNYYYAARYANIFFEGKEKPFDLKDIAARSEKAVPNTFESYYLRYLATKDGIALLKAEALSLKRPEAMKAMITFYKISGNVKGVNNNLKTWHDSGEWSSGMLKWNYNLLASLPLNAILVSWGDNDTYPAWLLQEIQAYRTDVSIICGSLLGAEEYVSAALKEYGIPIFAKRQANFSDFPSYVSAIIEHIDKVTDRPVYLGIVMNQAVLDKLEVNLFLEGLAFRLNDEPYDNVAVIKNNYENKFVTDYLKVDLDNDISQPIVDQINLNYLPSFLLLYENYKASGEQTETAALKTLIERIADRGGRKEEVIAYLQTKKPINDDLVFDSGLRARDIDKMMLNVMPNLYASMTEVSNEQYEKFLQGLLSNKEFEHLETCKTRKTDWLSYLPAKHSALSKDILFDHGNPDEADTPIQNITWEAANLYCEWLTLLYNNSTDKKKKFKKAVFRLPTESEWEAAAKGGLSPAPYAWGGYYYKNTKGCYLLNCQALEEDCEECKEQPISIDGGFFTVITNAYFPNGFGLYNVNGNVAEMIQNRTRTKGGGWLDHPEECKIDAKGENTAPSPNIGFRVFMEVIEK